MFKKCDVLNCNTENKDGGWVYFKSNHKLMVSNLETILYNSLIIKSSKGKIPLR